MATNFPTTLDTFTNPTGTDPLSNPSHAAQHSDINDAVEALQAKVGVDSSAVTTSLDSRVKTIEDNSAPKYFVENLQTTNYTLALVDVAKVVAFDSASNLTLTVPLNSSVTFPIGTVINVYRAGTGTVTIAGSSGVTVRNVGEIADQFAEVSLRKRGTDEWVLTGNIA
jgi:hypothetical protein